MLDQLTELVYREVYLDTLSTIREIRNEAEEILEAKLDEKTDLESLQTAFMVLWDKLRTLDKTLSGLSLPREIYRRVGQDLKETDAKLVKSWERYVSHMRTTRA